MPSKKLTAAALKWLAILSMFSDHVGKILAAFLPDAVSCALQAFGRLAFPLFCFLLTEGFFHTRSRKNYLLRLALFALLSEIPYDLAFGQPDAQNVFFTLAIGFLAMCYLSRYPAVTPGFYGIACLFALLAQMIGADYGAPGVLCILLFCFARRRPSASRPAPPQSGWLSCLLSLSPLLVFAASGSPLQVFCLTAAVPIRLYGGERGRSGPKYFFYLFYPLHLLLLFALRGLLIHLA